MRLLYALILILLFGKTSFSQNKEIDSLTNLIVNAKTDSAIVQNLQKKSRAYRKIDSLNLAYETSLEMLQVAEREGNEKRIGWSQREIAFNLNKLDRVDEGILRLKNYVATLSEADTAVLANSYRYIGFFYAWNENYAEGLKFFFKVTSLL